MNMNTEIFTTFKMQETMYDIIKSNPPYPVVKLKNKIDLLKQLHT